MQSADNKQPEEGDSTGMNQSTKQIAWKGSIGVLPSENALFPFLPNIFIKYTLDSCQ